MRLRCRPIVLAAALAVPILARPQHSHGSGTDLPPRRSAPDSPSPPAKPRGLLPPGSPRQIEVLVLSWGFSPISIHAEPGEEIVLLVQRIDESPCAGGLAIPSRQLLVELPRGDTVPVALKLDRAETIDVRCANEETRASIVVAPPP